MTETPKNHDAMFRKIMMQKLGLRGAMKMMGKSIFAKKIGKSGVHPARWFS